MPNVGEIAAALEQLAPLAAAEDWDNVGLLVGDRARPVTRLMTCLTVTPAAAAEAIDDRVEMIVVHHPLPFRPLTRITADDTTGRLLWELIRAGVSVYSAHTAFDSAHRGINEQWATRLGLQEVHSLLPGPDVGENQTIAGGEVRGGGRYGELRESTALGEVIDRIKAEFSIDHVRFVGDPDGVITRVAVACGSGGSFLGAARAKECNCLITGEASFHACLEAEATGVALVLCGHFVSERFAMEWLAAELSLKFPAVKVWASRREQDPIRES